MVFIKITSNGKLSVQLELPTTSISFIADDESFMAEIMDFISETRLELSEESGQNELPSSIPELDLSNKISIPAVLSKDSEIEGGYLLQIKLSHNSVIVHSVSVELLESLLIAFKDANIHLDES